MSDSPGTVFVADDNASILQGLERALRASGYSVHTAMNGAAVMALLESAPQPPDLVLLDVMMPEMSGLEVLHRLRTEPRWADVPVVLITATNDGALPVSALRDGAVDFLTKPFRLDELLARVHSHVRRNRDLRRAREQARIRLETIDLIRELNRVVTADEMFQLVTTRTAEILGVGRCSVLVVERGEDVARVAASSEKGVEEGFLLRLSDYPEVREALTTGAPVKVPYAPESELFAGVRESWESRGFRRPLRSAIVVPFAISDGMTGLFVERSTIDEPELGDEAAELAVRVVEAIVQACDRVQVFQRLVEQRERLHDLANTDELTGCSTRRSLLLYLQGEMDAARDRGESISIAVLDLDHFKQINDTCGHIAGDAVLRALGAWLTAEGSVRSRDRSGRYGGDEFVAVLPGTTAAGARRFAERARRHISSIPFVFGEVAVRATLSAGVTSWPDCEALTGEEIIAIADAALYAAKERGRDQVCLAREVGVG